MASGRNYKDFERRMTPLLLAAAAIFLLFLIVSGAGIVWLKIVTAIVAILLCILCLALLYLSRELLRQRSLWLTAGFGSILLCTVVSLLLSFPGPAL